MSNQNKTFYKSVISVCSSEQVSQLKYWNTTEIKHLKNQKTLREPLHPLTTHHFLQKLLEIISAEKVWKRFGMISYGYKTLPNLLKTQTFYTFLQHFSYVFIRILTVVVLQGIIGIMHKVQCLKKKETFDSKGRGSRLPVLLFQMFDIVPSHFPFLGGRAVWQELVKRFLLF